MELFKPAENTVAYIKIGLFGDPGTGKTYLALSELAPNIADIIGTEKIFAADTESGSDFFVKELRERGYNLFQSKTKALNDVPSIISETEESGAILVIDSITHFWDKWVEENRKKSKYGQIQIQDWPRIKEIWNEKMVDPVLNSKCHIIVCGRRADTYQSQVNDRGKREMVIDGTKMKAEKNFAYELSFLFELHKYNSGQFDDIKNTIPLIQETIKRKTKNSRLIHVAQCLKDRSRNINGDAFVLIGWPDIKPCFDSLNIGGDHKVYDRTRDSSNLIDDGTDTNLHFMRKRNKEEALEEIKAQMVKAFPSTSAKEKKAKVLILEAVFNVSGWKKVEGMGVDKLLEGEDRIKHILSYPENIEKLLAGEAEDLYEPEPEDIPLGAVEDVDIKDGE